MKWFGALFFIMLNIKQHNSLGSLTINLQLKPLIYQWSPSYRLCRENVVFALQVWIRAGLLLFICYHQCLLVMKTLFERTGWSKNALWECQKQDGQKMDHGLLHPHHPQHQHHHHHRKSTEGLVFCFAYKSIRKGTKCKHACCRGPHLVDAVIKTKEQALHLPRSPTYTFL